MDGLKIIIWMSQKSEKKKRKYRNFLQAPFNPSTTNIGTIKNIKYTY